METTVRRHNAETIYISHPKASYGIFCFNEIGDLFLNSDWGAYCYAWRTYGADRPFKDFLAQCNAEYIVGKFGINFRNDAGRKMQPHETENVTILVEEFIKILKNDIDSRQIVGENSMQNK